MKDDNFTIDEKVNACLNDIRSSFKEGHKMSIKLDDDIIKLVKHRVNFYDITFAVAEIITVGDWQELVIYFRGCEIPPELQAIANTKVNYERGRKR
jgi:hypothetical protein